MSLSSSNSEQDVLHYPQELHVPSSDASNDLQGHVIVTGLDDSTNIASIETQPTAHGNAAQATPQDRNDADVYGALEGPPSATVQGSQFASPLGPSLQGTKLASRPLPGRSKTHDGGPEGSAPTHSTIRISSSWPPATASMSRKKPNVTETFRPKREQQSIVQATARHATPVLTRRRVKLSRHTHIYSTATKLMGQ